MTAGKHKGGMDPFSPINDEEKAYTQTILNDMHEHFKNVIRSSRGDKLTASEDEVFTGRAWIGVRAKELGLVDELTDLRSYVDKKYGKIPIREVPVRPDFFSFVRRGGFSSFSEVSHSRPWHTIKVLELVYLFACLPLHNCVVVVACPRVKTDASSI
mmetsp:Transcript_20617/g.53009  ORF Transcript_20617/g.53009 Transcript_20617/m.53009 type:complete len:157 (-) Transcript_20617:176-646(-)